MRSSALIRQRLFILFLAGVLLLFTPVIDFSDRLELWFGIPALYLYLFSVWALFIAVMAWIVRGPDE